MRGIKSYLVLLVAIVLGMAACAPKIAPVSTPAPAPSKAAPASGPVPLSMTPAEAAWAKTLDAAKKEGTVTVYSYWWVGDQGVVIARAFRQRYGIQVDVITGKGAEFLERLKTEKRMGKITADVFEGSATHSQNTKLEGLLGSTADLPMLQDKAGWTLDPLVFDPSSQILLHRPWTMVPFINTKLVKPEDAPKTWDDVLLPKWKGKMMVPDPRVTNLTYYLLLLQNHGDVGKDFIQRLAQQDLRFVRDTSDAARALSQGEVSLIPNMVDSNMAPFAQEGAPVKAVEVEKGTVVSGGVISWVKDGPHPNAAKVFINWVLSDEGQRVEAEVGGVFGMRQAVPDFRPATVQVKIHQPLVIGVKENEDIAKAFADKALVDVLTKGR